MGVPDLTVGVPDLKFIHEVTVRHPYYFVIFLRIMPRQPRIVIPNVPHHVTQRGNRRQLTFFCEDDYQLYCDIMKKSCKKYEVTILAYCLMPNHVHLVAVPTSESALRFAIGEAHERYTKQINLRMDWKGHLWQGRFFSVPMDDDYLNKCVRYIEQNPVRADLCKYPEDYKWSSAQAHLFQKSDPLIERGSMVERHPNWRDFLNKTLDSAEIDLIRKNSQVGRPLGSQSFIQKIEQSTGFDFTLRKPGPKSGTRSEIGA